MYFEIMKKFIIGALMALITFSAAAQNEVRAFEFEASIGRTYPLLDLRGEEYLGGGLNLALRYNHKKKPIDFGVEIHIMTVERKVEEEIKMYKLPDMDNSALSITTAYNFARGKNLSLFIGIGAGIPLANIVFSIHNYFYSSNLGPYLNMAFSPRIGVELGNHFRLTVDLRLLDKEHHAIFMRAGIVFGGGRKPIKKQETH